MAATESSSVPDSRATVTASPQSFSEALTQVGPLPRYRLYSSLRRYMMIILGVLTCRTGRGDDVQILEGRIAEWTGRRHAIAVPQARVGIYLTIRSLIKSGQRVIMSPYTIADVINMVISAGGIPVFCDVEENTCNIDPGKIPGLIDDDTGAIMITHLHGLAAHPREIRRICDEHRIPLIEDSAQAFGARVGEIRTGAFGTAGIFSFGMFKNINSAYGGMVVTDDDDVASAVREDLSHYEPESRTKILKRTLQGLITDLLTWPPLFKSIVFRVFRFGLLNNIELINRRVRTELDPSRHDDFRPSYRRKFTPLQARLVMRQLHRIDPDTGIRIEKAKIYYDGLKNVPQLKLPPPAFDGSHIYTYYPVRCQNRDDAIKFLMRNGCDIAPQHLKNCASLPGFDAFGTSCPEASDTAAEVILLPTYPRYSNRDIHRNIAVIKNWCSKQETAISTGREDGR